MTKKDLLKCLAKKTNKPVSQINEMLVSLVECITKTISKDDKLAIPGLSIWSFIASTRF